jgi:xylan 1,4-beta-xylosidase
MIGDGTARAFDLVLDGLPQRVRITRSLVDREHGWALPAWQEMGSPDWPTEAQCEILHRAAMPEVEAKVEPTREGRLAVMETLAPLAMMLIEIEPV